MSAEVDLDAFRQEVREFLAERLPPRTAERALAGYYLSRDEMLDWHRTLADRGWIGFNWPEEHGGPGWTPLQRYVFEDECARAGAPIINTVGLNQVASLLFAFGTEEQKRQHLPPIRQGSVMWCQGISETQSGSDLASLRCPAVRDGDEYVVNGSKIWTSGAHISEWCILVVRTDSSGRKHDGITILLLDMKTPGITIRPIVGLDGMHSLNEMFLDDVRVPVANRIGEENEGWRMMRVYLGNERISAAGIWKLKVHFSRLCSLARKEVRNGRPLIENRRFRDDMARTLIRMRALEVLLLDIIDKPEKATGVEASVLKLRGTELQQDLLRMLSDAAGYYALPFFPDTMKDGWGDQDPVGPEFAAPSTPNYLFWRKATISAGSSEIMLNLIARNVLG